MKIAGMTCDSCARGIAQRLVGEKGILQVDISYEQGSGVVLYDPTQIRADQIVAVVAQGGHYRVVNCEEEVVPQGKSEEIFDLIIIGGGSAAFAAAIHAEELGLRTLMVNDGLPIGGTCVNVGCVPSKFLVRAAESVWRATHSPFAGIHPRGVEVDFGALMQQGRELVAEMRQRKYLDVVRDFSGLTLVQGHAQFVDAHTIAVGHQHYRGHKLLIATGARPNVPDFEGLAHVNYHTSRTIFSLTQLPKTLTILGAGYVGLEMGQSFQRLGAHVRILAYTERVLRRLSPDISEELTRHLQAEGIELLPNFQPYKFESKDGLTRIHCRRPDGTNVVLEEPGTILVATGIRPNTDQLKLARIGVQLDSRGHIQVDSYLRTNLPHVYAAGDVATTPAYVYTAALEGKTAVHNAFSAEPQPINYEILPWVVFTDPQVAGVGIDERDAEVQGIPFEVRSLPLSEVPRSIAARDMRGFIKLIRHVETDRLLGARIVATEGGELVQQLSLAMRMGATVSELASGLCPYLTLSEGIKLAALTFGKDVRKLSCCAT